MTLLVNEMQTENDRKLSFLKFIEEREKIRIAKESGKPRPWTKDSILQEYSFCNVKRADDRVTKYIGEWAAEWPEKDRWFAFAVARWLNEPDTLEKMPRKWDPFNYKQKLGYMEHKGTKIFRAAYLITGAVSGPGKKKYVAVVDSVLDPLYKNKPRITNSFEECWKELKEHPGHGSFMAGQVCFDWQTFGVIKAIDTKIWAPLGPGSIKGLNIIYLGTAEAKKMTQATGVVWMRELFDLIEDKLPHIGKRLDLMDVQNCCCEFSKYCRGYSKQKYSPYEESFL